MARKTYQPIFLGKPYGSPVVGYNAALARRRAIVRANCSLSPRPATFNILETRCFCLCSTCYRQCYARIREVRHG